MQDFLKQLCEISRGIPEVNSRIDILIMIDHLIIFFFKCLKDVTNEKTDNLFQTKFYTYIYKKKKKKQRSAANLFVLICS